MTDIEVSEQLKGEAIGLGLCAQWTGEWKNESSQQELIDKYKKGLDFALKHDWPSPEFIDKAFDKGILHRNLIYNNEEVDIEDAVNGVYIFNGNCSGKIHIGWYSAATLYIRHRCELDIDCDGMAIVHVFAKDDSRSSVRVSDSANVSVICYGERSSVSCPKGVRFKRKPL